MSSGKLRHRAFALVPAASGTALGSPGLGFSRFPLAGEVWKPCRVRAAADAGAASLFPLARKKETRLSGCTGTPCPETAGNGSGRGDTWSQPCLAASVTDAMPVEPSTRKLARTGTPNRTTGHGWPENGRSWRLQNGCLPGIPVMRKRQGERNRIVESQNGFQAVGQWPSKRDPAEVWLKVLRGALFGAQLSWDSRFLE